MSANLLFGALVACSTPLDGKGPRPEREPSGVDTASTDTAPTDTGQGGTDTGDAPALPPLYAADRLQSPVDAAIRDVLEARVAAHPELDTLVFMKVGDSITADPSALGCFAGDDVDLGTRTDLQGTVDHFKRGEAGSSTPWDRDSRAAESGQTAAWALSGDPSPAATEWEKLDPAFAVVQYGTNDMEMDVTYKDALYGFADDMLDLVDALLGWGTVPLLVTIPPRGDESEADEWVPRYNAVVRGIGQARQVPVVDLELGLRPLDDYGLYSDGVHPEPAPSGACKLRGDALDYGTNMRNLLVLDGLDRLRRAGIDGESFDEGVATLGGAGTVADPYRIPSTLPFTDLRDTRTDGVAATDAWTGCAADTPETGREVVYRLDLDRETTVRAMVFDRGGVDVDLHLLGASGDAEDCRERDDRHVKATLDAGSWYLVVDTWGDDGGAGHAGEYLLVVLEG